jgi:hypothetical protein
MLTLKVKIIKKDNFNVVIKLNKSRFNYTVSIELIDTTDEKRFSLKYGKCFITYGRAKIYYVSQMLKYS